MFGGRQKGAGLQTHAEEQTNGSTGPASARAPSDGPVPPESGLTVGSSCTCGHPRIDHRGLRMDVCGPCLECDCEQFTQIDETLERLRAALAQAEQLRVTAAGLRELLNARDSLPHANGAGERPV